MEDRTMFCPECGEQLPDDAQFCGLCGFKITVQPSAAASAEPEAIEESVPVEPSHPEPPLALEPAAVSSPKPPKRSVRWRLPLWGWIILAVVIVVGIGVGIVLILGGGSVPDTPGTSNSTPSFSDAVGEWESNDIGDGSYQTMTITQISANRFHVEIWDRGATGCGVDGSGDPIYGATIEGDGSASGTLLTDSGAEAVCLSEPPDFLMLVDLELRYQASSDTVIGYEGVEWTRRQ
jgi:hypothetical protein